MNTFDQPNRIGSTRDIDITFNPSSALQQAAALSAAFPDDKKGEAVKVKPIMAVSHIGRNELCKCGSGKKFKRCCMGDARKKYVRG